LNIDISTILLIYSIISGVFAFIITSALYGAKSMRSILGYWGLSQFLLAAGLILVVLRNFLPDFFSIIVANAFIVASQIAIQEGISRYIGKTGYLRKASFGILAAQIVFFLFFTYVHPDVTSRIVVYAMSISLISLFILISLFSRDVVLKPPLFYLIGLLIINIGFIVFRLAFALTQGYYSNFLQSGFFQAIGLLGNLTFTVSLVSCFFWLIAYRLRLESQQAEENLQTAKDELERINKELQIAAMTDGLTLIANRRYFDEQFIRLWRDAKRHGKPLSVVMADIDFFKAYNDEYGHSAGDDCLKKVANVLRIATKRAADFTARYGGEEFIVILPDTDCYGADKLAERLRANVQELNIAHKHSPVGNVTISLGISTTIPMKEQDSVDLINAADKALYDAKSAGRNCICRALEL